MTTLFPVLDVLLAGHFAAWSLSFVTAARAKQSLENMRRNAPRVGLGIIAIMIGMTFVIAARITEYVGHEHLSHWLNLVAYPVFLLGPLALASATWTQAIAAPADNRRTAS